MTDEQRRALRKDALLEHHEAEDDRQEQHARLANTARILRTVADALEEQRDDSSIDKLPSRRDVRDALSELQTAETRLSDAREQCRNLGLRTNGD